VSEYQQHPLSAAFPKMSDAAFAELRADIAANGLLAPITLYEDKVLDGWHRFCACDATGTEPRFRTFEGDESAARQFVVSANLMRRHLDTGERAMVAARFATLPTNRPDKGAKLRSSMSVDEAAELFNVSARTVNNAHAVLASGDDAMIADVQSGKVSVSGAAKQLKASTPKPAPKPKQLPANVTALPINTGSVTLEQWAALAPDMRTALLRRRNSRATLNRQNEREDGNAIDWARFTWNPITGCLHDCPYCYARDIAERFHSEGSPAFPDGFAPALRADRLSAPINQLPPQSDDPRDARIFTGSMADMFGRWVPAEWINAVLGIAREARQWEFLMLTKFPKRMSEFEIPNNVWMGTTVDCQARVAAAEAGFERVQARVKWLSVEPMLEPIRFSRLDRFNLLVIGGASVSKNTPRWIPPFEWVADLMRQADDAGCAVFLKSNLYRKEFPGGPRYRFTDELPRSLDYLGRTRVADGAA
jgi:protein gp37